VTKLDWNKAKMRDKMQCGGAVAYAPSFRSEPATEKQLRYIRYLGVETEGHSYTKRSASALIDRLTGQGMPPSE
jgi:hypothetical protein